jgi:4'-phosphopantetheinyl transferase
MVKVYYTAIDSVSPEEVTERMRQELPAGILRQAARYHQLPDQLRCMLGKWLLKEALERENSYEKTMLERLQLDQYNRPYLESSIDFNLSHSGKYAVCALSTISRVGVDIEEIRAINWEDFQLSLSEKDRETIESSTETERMFFKIWTRKEAVTKANGKGLGIPFDQLDVYRPQVNCEGKNWNTHFLDIDSQYVACLAYEEQKLIKVEEVKLSEIALWK